MANLAKKLLSHVKEFIESSPKAAAVNLREHHFAQIIHRAKIEDAALHVIYGDKHFTGDVIKFDHDKGQLILKNFTNNVTAIISLTTINKISLVPKTIRKAHKINH